MQWLWCWRCKMRMPMLDEDEYARVRRALAVDMQQPRRDPPEPPEIAPGWSSVPDPDDPDYEAYWADCRAASQEMEYPRAIAVHFAITGVRITNPAAMAHHRLALYGPPCARCRRPLRSPQARLCGSCMHPVGAPVNHGAVIPLPRAPHVIRLWGPRPVPGEDPGEDRS